jgi:hypothetical protein
LVTFALLAFVVFAAALAALVIMRPTAAGRALRAGHLLRRSARMRRIVRAGLAVTRRRIPAIGMERVDVRRLRPAATGSRVGLHRTVIRLDALRRRQCRRAIIDRGALIALRARESLVLHLHG